jgi:hypothetical protein
LRSLCERIVVCSAPATAVHVRDIVMLVFRYLTSAGRRSSIPVMERFSFFLQFHHTMDVNG